MEVTAHRKPAELLVEIVGSPRSGKWRLPTTRFRQEVGRRDELDRSVRGYCHHLNCSMH